MSKNAVTRTYGPIHFEDLDPHRFEDLIRELIYDYKDWQAIEATGRSGNDEGFDIRAYEKQVASTDEDEDGETDGHVSAHPMEGNLWMIQGKRERELGPKRVQGIVSEINDKDPPYGYILAAPANFSKDSYDVFRKALREKGVMEFYMWGRAELEDMLHLPKNDRILFTFFGISLVSRRRSRATETRSVIAVKNKLFRILGESEQFHQAILVRDLADTNYPYKDEYPDFEEHPRWLELQAYRFHTRGILVHIRKRYAYLDLETKEYDFTRAFDLLFRNSEEDSDRRKAREQQELVTDVFDFFPRSKQAFFCADGLIAYADIAIVDDKGDVQNKVPHLYLDFVGKNAPFSGHAYYFERNDEHISLTDEFRKVNVFPEVFVKAPPRRPLVDKKIELDAGTLKQFKEYKAVDALYDVDGRYAYLEQRDIVAVAGAEVGAYFQVTHKFKTTVSDYLNSVRDGFVKRRSIQQQIAREPNQAEPVTVYEVKRTYWHDDET